MDQKLDHASFCGHTSGMRGLSLSANLALCLGLWSCGQPRTATWYVKHPAEIKATLDKCLTGALDTNGAECRAVKNAYLRTHGATDAY